MRCPPATSTTEDVAIDLSAVGNGADAGTVVDDSTDVVTVAGLRFTQQHGRPDGEALIATTLDRRSCRNGSRRQGEDAEVAVALAPGLDDGAVVGSDDRCDVVVERVESDLHRCRRDVPSGRARLDVEHEERDDT